MTMNGTLPGWLNPDPWLARARRADAVAVRRALEAEDPGIDGLAALLSPCADVALEAMAARAQSLTRRHFGRTIALFVPLYMSDFCRNGCLYCGFATDRRRPRRRLEQDDLIAELDAIAALGFGEILLLTGERTPQAGFDYVHEAVRLAADRFQQVCVEVFPMETAEYRRLADAGCTGITVFQETYDPAVYAQMHRWGPKRDFRFRLDTPARALEAGLRTAGLGALLGLADPIREALCLFQHIELLRRQCWRGGLSISFPRIRPQRGGFQPPCPAGDRLLTRLICALRICLPDVTLTLSTREPPRFRDGIAGIGINKMSAASRTTVGGYHDAAPPPDNGQFAVSDDRSVSEFCGRLRARGLEPVFKNWDRVYRGAPIPA